MHFNKNFTLIFKIINTSRNGQLSIDHWDTCEIHIIIHEECKHRHESSSTSLDHRSRIFAHARINGLTLKGNMCLACVLQNKKDRPVYLSIAPEARECFAHAFLNLINSIFVRKMKSVYRLLACPSHQIVDPTFLRRWAFSIHHQRTHNACLCYQHLKFLRTPNMKHLQKYPE